MRVAIAEFKQETNTFVPRPTTLADFEAWHYWRGSQLIDGLQGTNTEIDGFLNVLSKENIESVPILATFAMSGGRVTDEAYQFILADLISGLESVGPLDGILLSLHGAMVTESNDAADAETLAAVRALVGPDTPIVVSLDLHANLTRESVALADAIVGFKTAPHIDLRDTGERAARLMAAILNDQVKPAMAFTKIPMITPASAHLHHLPGPFKRLFDHTIDIESHGALSASLFTVQPWLDIDDMGYAAIVVTDGSADQAEQFTSELAQHAWDEREALMNINLVPPAEAIQQALAESAGPVVISDCADGTGAGSPGDATAVIEALLEANSDAMALTFIRDAEAAHLAIESGVGSAITLEIGGKLDTVFNKPISVTGTITFAGPVSFRFTGEGYTGVDQDMGPSAVIRSGNVHILIISQPIMGGDPASYRAVGLEPADARIVMVKSHGQFRGAYDGLAIRAIMLDTPGMSSDNIVQLPFKKIQRPIFPLDRSMEWTVSSQSGQNQEVSAAAQS